MMLVLFVLIVIAVIAAYIQIASVIFHLECDKQERFNLFCGMVTLGIWSAIGLVSFGVKQGIIG